MRRSSLTAPFAFLSSACLVRPWTPSVAVASWAEPPPLTLAVIETAQPDAIGLWQLPPDNPWLPYEKLTLLTAIDSLPSTVALPDVAGLEVVQAAGQAAESLAAVGLPPGTLWIVDVRGAASVAFGSTLTRRARTRVTPVLTFNNWPADREMIPAEETLSALLTMPPRIESGPGPTHPIFLMDAWRLAYRDEAVDDDVTDNRYMLNPADLPAAEVLVEQGIRRIVYVVESRAETDTEEDDLNDTFYRYQSEGIRFSMVDFASLGQLADRKGLRLQSPLEAMLESCDYRIALRETLVKDPQFYLRARGGFGGIAVLGFGGGSGPGGGFWAHGAHGHGGG
jgi:hypothetical protein